eukprot:CAMPEP_0172391664 /NCGR_PEP_ID=MMETSP1061-20121228/8017_1 /TAXON_ID=37318 /ORGANISM="Pseudo-nitzschia pungens, Strain cf. pungens" /LENGTH=512 /DNA_ID=CAMNT_0013122345 /DNA_START=189 /DNA_END=1727 /DNA_ORIENTATION=+
MQQSGTIPAVPSVIHSSATNSVSPQVVMVPSATLSSQPPIASMVPAAITTTATTTATATSTATSTAPLPAKAVHPAATQPHLPAPVAAAAPNPRNSRKRAASETTTDHSKTTTTTATTATNNATSNATSNATTTTTTRVGKDGEPLSEKKLRRLEKNRLSARECRRRKREATENMQGQINQLESENLRLRLQLQVGEEAEQTNHQKQIDSTLALDELLKSGKASESEIYAKIEEYKEKFADYGRDRRSAMEFHLRNVERLLMPTQTTSFIMSTLKDSGGASSGQMGSSDTTMTTTTTTTTTTTHSANPSKSTTTTTTTLPSAEGPTGQAPLPSTALGAPPQTEEAAATNTNTTNNTNTITIEGAAPKTSKELFTLLVKKLEVTPAQAAVLKDSRFVAEDMDQTLKETLTVLKELRVRLAQCGQDLETEFDCIRQILTPSQSARFLVWVAQNKACMHMLNELWSKNYPTTASASVVAAAAGNGNGNDAGASAGGAPSSSESVTTTVASASGDE